MATQVQHPVVSTLNPNAPLFVPAAAVAYNRRAVVEDFSLEWWSLVQTCPEFRAQWVRDRMPVVEEQEMFEAEIEEIADLDAFLEYQDEMQELEASLHFDDVDDDGDSLLYLNAICCRFFSECTVVSVIFV